ncbi:MAG: 16S rRNA (guanine(966)-N(2))-methyltransferase RsmD [Polyangiaceae bacterium]|nr:16S rRNA (guanine(966)-N(2))-methyltransferase RsmD [Polyangiaceae bacterium]
MRVVGGRFGGRHLRAPRGDKTRPTADRVKEALFSILGPIDGAVVADVFAGTGALGIEALSRGAARAVFLDPSPQALEVLRDNLASLKLASPEAVVLSVRAERAAAILAEHGPFDLLLLDPPYAQLAIATDVLAAFARAGLLGEGACAVLEHAAKDEPSPEGWEVDERRRYGDTTLSFFKATAPSHSEVRR